MGLRFTEFHVCNQDGTCVDLMAQTKDDALYTGSELLDEPLEKLTAHRPTDW
jgi:hypothetical protein